MTLHILKVVQDLEPKVSPLASSQTRKHLSDTLLSAQRTKANTEEAYKKTVEQQQALIDQAQKHLDSLTQQLTFIHERHQQAMK
eukprot:2235994-Karenia_brevis.AAC.1